MNTTIETRFVRTVLAASIATIFSVPAVWAQEDDVAQLIRPDSTVELGVGYVSEDSFKYGDYTGLNREGLHLIGNVDMYKRDEGARYLQLQGRNLGLRSRSLGVETGEQGNYGVRIEYDQIPKFYSDSYETPYLGAGSTVLTRPAGVTRGANVGTIGGSNAIGLRNNMRPYDIDSVRKGLGLGFTKQLARDWQGELNFRREKKEGDKLTAAMMQVGTGGSRGSVIVPEPIDYTTDQYEALARYTSEKLQVQVGYYASLFKNDNQSLTWDNLFTGTGNLTGRFALPPDNEFHQVSASAAYSLTSATRLSGNLSFGRMTQNEAFLPYSTSGIGVTGGLAETLPIRASLDGKAYTTNASLRLTTKLMPKLGLTAGWRYDDRDNKTASTRFDYITGDRNVTGATSAANLAQTRFNLPLDIRKQVLYGDLDYHLAPETTLKFGYDFHKVKHNYEPTTGDEEHTVKAAVHQRFGETLSADFSYAYSDRDASAYNGALPLPATYTQAFLNTLLVSSGEQTGRTYAWLEAPTLRKYYLADRKRDKLGLNANYSPADQLDLQFGAHYNRDRYPDTDVPSGIGLTKATGWMLSFDATVHATDALSGNFFASLDQYKTDQSGAHLAAVTTGLTPAQTVAANRPLVSAAETGTIPAANMAVTTLTDRTLTLGFGVRYKPARKYEVGGNFTHSDSEGRSKFVVVGGTPAPGFTVAPLPDLVSRLNRLEMFGSYFLQKNVTVKLRYAYERYKSADWAWDAPLNLTSVGATGTGGVVGTNHISPKYNVHFVGVSAAYQF